MNSENTIQTHSSSKPACGWEIKALGIIASITALVVSIIFAEHFQTGAAFYASCTGGGASLIALTYFAIRACGCWNEQKKVDKIFKGADLPLRIEEQDRDTRRSSDQNNSFSAPVEIIVEDDPRNQPPQIVEDDSQNGEPPVVKKEPPVIPPNHNSAPPIIPPFVPSVSLQVGQRQLDLPRTDHRDNEQSLPKNSSLNGHNRTVSETKKEDDSLRQDSRLKTSNIPLPVSISTRKSNQPLPISQDMEGGMQPIVQIQEEKKKGQKPTVEKDSKKEDELALSESRRGIARKDSFNTTAPLRKHKIRQFQFANLSKVEGEGIPKKQASYWDLLAPLWKPIQAISDYLLSGGPLQQRAYYHLLSSLLDPMIAFLDMNPVKSAPVIEKFNHIIFNLNNRHYERFRFLINEECCKSKIQHELHFAFLTLIQITNPSCNFSVTRYNFFQHLNAAFNSADYQNNIKEFRRLPPKDAIAKYPEIAFMQNLGFAIFTEMHFGTYADESVFTVFEKGHNKVGEYPSPEKPIHEILKEDHESIERVPKDYRGGQLFAPVNQVEGHINVNFRPLEKNNFASEYWRSHYMVGGQTHSMSCLRFGTPTSENGLEQPQILPIMYLFLDYCVREGLKVASFQHQNPKKKGTGKGDESGRLNKMFELAETEEYQEVFFPFGLVMDGDFYKQEGIYSALEFGYSEKFIPTFLEQLLSGKFLIRIPVQKLQKKLPQINKEIEKIVRDVHVLFFKKAETMTVEDRRMFQLITYAYLVEYFSIGLKVDFFHCQCKDAQDRAVVLLATIYYLSMIRRGKENDREEIRKFRAYVEFACLMIKGLSLHHHRFPLLEKTIEHLSKLSLEEKEAIRSNATLVNGKPAILQEVTREEVPNQTLYPLPSEARVEQDYFKYLKEEVERSRAIKFKLNYFVQQFFHVEGRKNYVQSLNMQFRIKDVPRQHYLINSKKMELPSFEAELKKLAANSAYKEEFSGRNPVEIVQYLVKLESQTVDPQAFCQALIQIDGFKTFKDAVRKLYHELRAQEVEKLALSWTNNDSDRAQEILALSQQGILANITAVLEQRYKFIPGGLNDLKKNEEQCSDRIIQVFQRDPQGTSNTCFNYLIENGHRIIEAYQLYEIAQGEERKTLFYVVSKTRIDLETGHADVLCLPPALERPKDISAIAYEMNRTAKDLSDSFIDIE